MPHATEEVEALASEDDQEADQNDGLRDGAALSEEGMDRGDLEDLGGEPENEGDHDDENDDWKRWDEVEDEFAGYLTHRDTL